MTDDSYLYSLYDLLVAQVSFKPTVRLKMIFSAVLSLSRTKISFTEKLITVLPGLHLPAKVPQLQLLDHFQ